MRYSCARLTSPGLYPAMSLRRLRQLSLANTDLFRIDFDEGVAPVLAEVGCGLHSLETRRMVTMNNWVDTWDTMEQECREEAVLLPYPAIRHTLDGYLKKHSFCSECTNMVNKAYTLLVEEGQVRPLDYRYC